MEKDVVGEFTRKIVKKLDLNRKINEIIDASGRYSQTYPFYMYRKGKYVTEEEQKIRSIQEYISKNLYDKCFQELSISKKSAQKDDIIDCYKQKVAIFRSIIDASKNIK